MMKVWMLVMVVIGVGAKNHNEHEHHRLCAVLSAAVSAHKSKNGGDALQKALNRTIFGNESGGDLETLKGALPGDYKGEDASRGYFCGQMPDSQRQRFPGHSAPHDMVCLCTVGPGGWPFREDDNSGTGIDRLCGKGKGALGGDSDGWGDRNYHKGETQMEATWGSVMKECLEDGKGSNLKKALDTFTGELEHKRDKILDQNHNILEVNQKWATVYKNRYQLGEGEPDEDYKACDGTKAKGVCVLYYNASYPLPWWTDLAKAIKTEEAEKKRREEEKRKQEAQLQQQQSPSSEGPRVEAVTSAPPSTNETQRPHTENATVQFRMLNMTSGTPIIHPCTWLLSAAFI